MVWRIGRGDNTCSGVVTKLRESNWRRDLSVVLHERISLYIIDCIYWNWRGSSPQQSTYRARSFPRTHLRAHQQESKNRTPWELHLDPRANSQVLKGEVKWPAWNSIPMRWSIHSVTLVLVVEPIDSNTCPKSNGETLSTLDFNPGIFSKQNLQWLLTIHFYIIV